MFQFDFFNRISAANDESSSAAPCTEPTTGEFIPFEEPATPALTVSEPICFLQTETEPVAETEPVTAAELVTEVEPVAKTEPVAETEPVTAAEPVAEAENWQPPMVGGCSAPTPGTFKAMLGYAENLLISLNNRSSLERKPTRDLSVAYTRNYVAESYEAALRNHNVVSCMGKLVFPLPGITVTDTTDTQYLVGTLTPTFSSYNWRFAYTDEQAYTSRFAAACYAAPAVDETEAEVAPLTPADYLTGCGYRVQSISTKAETLPTVLRQLVNDLAAAVSDPLVSDFLQDVRSNIPTGKPGHYDMSSAPMSSQNLLTSLLPRMAKLGLFTFMGINNYTRVVNYSVSHCDPCVRFLNGQWLELYTTDLCTRVVNELAEQYHLPVSLASNIVLTDPAEPEVPCHELDCAFTIGGQFFWIEAKSSSRNVNYDKYRILGQLLGVIPDQFLLVNSDLNPDEIAGIRWLYPYHLANCTTFANALRAMVTDALEASGAIPSTARAA